jgi:hypothetical protein
MHLSPPLKKKPTHLFVIFRCKAKDAMGLEILVDPRGGSEDQTRDADDCSGVEAAEHAMVSAESPTDQTVRSPQPLQPT